MQLETENGTKHEEVSEVKLRSTLAALNDADNTFAILSSGGEHYLQTVSQDDAFVIEKRDGSFDRHFRARSGERHQFTKDEVVQVFSAYLLGQPESSQLTWEPMSMPKPGSIPAHAQAASRYLLIGLFAALLLGALAWSWYSRWVVP